MFTKCVWAPPLVEAKCCVMQQNNTRFLSGTATCVQFQPWTTACALKMYLKSVTIESLDYITLNLYCQNTVPRGLFPVWVSPSIWSTWGWSFIPTLTSCGQVQTVTRRDTTLRHKSVPQLIAFWGQESRKYPSTKAKRNMSCMYNIPRAGIKYKPQ